MNKVTAVENIEMLRNLKNYNTDLDINDYSFTRIKENSVWNALGFNVTRNYSVGVMCDILEGVCHYDLPFILT